MPAIIFLCQLFAIVLQQRATKFDCTLCYRLCYNNCCTFVFVQNNRKRIGTNKRTRLKIKMFQFVRTTYYYTPKSRKTENLISLHNIISKHKRYYFALSAHKCLSFTIKVLHT